LRTGEPQRGSKVFAACRKSSKIKGCEEACLVAIGSALLGLVENILITWSSALLLSAREDVSELMSE
jgi:hypothetical protein